MSVEILFFSFVVNIVIVDGLTVRALSNHICDPTVINSHLALSLARLTEQQAVIVSLNKKVNCFENQHYP